MSSGGVLVRRQWYLPVPTALRLFALLLALLDAHGSVLVEHLRLHRRRRLSSISAPHRRGITAALLVVVQSIAPPRLQCEKPCRSATKPPTASLLRGSQGGHCYRWSVGCPPCLSRLPRKQTWKVRRGEALSTDARRPRQTHLSLPSDAEASLLSHHSSGHSLPPSPLHHLH